MSTFAALSSPVNFRVDQMGQVALDNLGAHFAQCMPKDRAMHRLLGTFEAMNEFFMPRIVTSVAGVGLNAAVLIYLVS